MTTNIKNLYIDYLTNEENSVYCVWSELFAQGKRVRAAKWLSALQTIQDEIALVADASKRDVIEYVNASADCNPLVNSFLYLHFGYSTQQIVTLQPINE